MERRLLLAILLTFLVLTVYQWMLPKAPPSQTTSPAPATSPAIGGGGTGGTSGSRGGGGTSGSGASGATSGANGQSSSSAPTAPVAEALPPVQTLVADTTDK